MHSTPTISAEEINLKTKVAGLSSAEILPADWRIVSKQEDILALQPQLIALAASCGQAGTMEFLDYFLTVPYFGLQVPHPFLRGSKFLADTLLTRRSKQPRLLLLTGAGGLEAAVLLLEYRISGLPTGVLIPMDGDGYRTVIAPPEHRGTVARQAAQFLLKHKAFLVLLSYIEESERLIADPLATADETAAFRDDPRLIATELREAARRLPLAATYDDTLALMGPRTRRNLRAFERRAVKELGAVYMPRAEMSLSQFLEVNSASMFAVPDWVARWRYNSARTMDGGIFAGLRAADGRWLSVLGAHRHGQTIWLDWQMNRNGFGSLSLVTAMRAFFIAHAIAMGMRWMRFEGGTTHSMSGAFMKEYARDLVFARAIVPPHLLRRISAGASSGGMLANVLTSRSLIWRS